MITYREYVDQFVMPEFRRGVDAMYDVLMRDWPRIIPPEHHTDFPLEAFRVKCRLEFLSADEYIARHDVPGLDPDTQGYQLKCSNPDCSNGGFMTADEADSSPRCSECGATFLIFG